MIQRTNSSRLGHKKTTDSSEEYALCVARVGLTCSLVVIYSRWPSTHFHSQLRCLKPSPLIKSACRGLLACMQELWSVMASSPGASFPHQLLYRWDPIFDTPQNISDRHDEPFLKVRDEFDTASDFINCFMQVFDENDFCHHATDTVANFCAGANPNSLKDNASARTDPIAVLDDSNALTSWELYEALKSLFVSNENLKGKGKENNVSIRQTTTQNKASKRGIHRL